MPAHHASSGSRCQHDTGARSTGPDNALVENQFARVAEGGIGKRGQRHRLGVLGSRRPCLRPPRRHCSRNRDERERATRVCASIWTTPTLQFAIAEQIRGRMTHTPRIVVHLPPLMGSASWEQSLHSAAWSACECTPCVNRSICAAKVDIRWTKNCASFWGGPVLPKTVSADRSCQKLPTCLIRQVV